MRWMCANLLMSPFELVHFITVFDDEYFDILNVRLTTKMKDLSFDMLMLYVGLNLKTHFNYYPQSLSAQNYKDEPLKGHNHLV